MLQGRVLSIDLKDMDSGAWALALALHTLGVAADPVRIKFEAAKPLDELALLRAAKKFPVKARAVTVKAAKLPGLPLPALAQIHGSFVVVAKYVDGQILILGLEDRVPKLVPVDEFMNQTQGRLIMLAKRAPTSDLNRRFNLGWFIQAARKYRHIFAEVLLASLVIQLFALATPIIFQTVIDKVLVHRGYATLEVMVAGLALIAIFDTVLSGLRTWLFAHTSNRIDVELGTRLFSHLLRLPLAYFSARRVGDSVARVRELETIRQFITSSTMTAFLDLIFGMIFVGVMFAYSPSLTWIVVATFPLYALLSLASTPPFRRRLEEKFNRGAENQAFLVESITGIETIKSMAVEPQMQLRWEEQLAAYVGASFATSQIGNWTSQAANLFNKVLTAVLLFIGAGLVIDNKLSVGELVAFNMFAGQVSGPVLRLVQVWQDFHQTKISIERLGDILNTPVESQGISSIPSMRFRGDIEFERVTFRYGLGNNPVLRNVNLKIPAGQVVGIVGPSGSGKSTFAKLVQRLYQPEVGRVLVDGTDTILLDTASLRSRIGVVLQDSMLFNRSVRENISLADPAMPFEKVVAAAQLAGAHEFVSALPAGYDTVVGERGTSLSGGQRQRIAIARALLGDPSILIFDEATSALDSESEAAIQANMKKICRGRTVLIIAHRLSTVRHADRILSIENGEVVEDGTHDSLVSSEGRYAKLYKIQAGLR